MVFWRAIVIAGALGLSAAAAQQNATADPKQSGLKRVEGGVADVDPLGTSLRQLSVDLRQPVGFSGVYRVSSGRSPTGREAFVRMSGATAAVFDQSTYIPTATGPTPGIPAGTVFYIGGLPAPRPTARTAAEGGTLISTAVDMRAPVSVDTSANTNKVLPRPVESTGSTPEATSAAEQVANQWPQDAASRERAQVQRAAGTGILGDEKYRGARITELLRQAAERAAAAATK